MNGRFDILYANQLATALYSEHLRDPVRHIGRATELDIASRRPDGTLRPFVTIWVVRAGDEVYARSAYGYANPRFQRALASGEANARATSARIAGERRPPSALAAISLTFVGR